MGNTETIAKNTAFLYLRMFLIMIINLFSLRLIIKSLGAEQYGVYNVIAGVITLLNSVSAVLASATQRFYSFYLGKGDESRLRKAFSTSIIIYSLFSIVTLILAETIGLWFVNNRLVIPSGSLEAANWLYQFTVLTFIISLFQVPYSASVIAHEDMGFFALVSLLDCVLRFLVVLVLFAFSAHRLELYGLFLLIVAATVLLIYARRGKLKYEECHFIKTRDKSLFKEVLSFSGWTFVGSIAGTGMIQCNTILVNLFFGAIVNAARGISLHVSSAINMLSSCFIMAIRPPMVKAYARGDNDYVIKLFKICNTLVFYLLLMICVPLYLEMDTILRVWLDTTDNNSILFSKLIVVYSLLFALHNPITIIMQAIGRLKEYHVPVESFIFLSFPLTYVLYKMGASAEYTYYTMIFSVLAAQVTRIIVLNKHYEPFSVRQYLMQFIFPASFVALSVFVSCSVVHSFVENSYIRFGLVLCTSIASSFVFAFVFGVNSEERSQIHVFVKHLLKTNSNESQ